MDSPPLSRLLAFARELQRAATFEELLLTTQAELKAAVGYEHAWLFVADHEDAQELRLIDVVGSKREQAWEVAPVLRIGDDAMLKEVLSSDLPVVVADARVDPRTDKNIVAQLGNRTIVNVPLRLLDKPFGAFGTGTFGDAEGCRPPTPEQLDYLIGMGGQLAVAAGRIRFLAERKRADEALRLTEAQLRHAQKMEAIGRLAGSVAHDFNNLLSVILSYSGMLLTDLKPVDPIRADVQAIKTAGERAADLTRQLLAFSRQQVLKLEVLNLNELVQGSERMLRRLLREDIELVTRYDRDLCKVRVDSGQIDQVVMNLALNARDAMPEGGKLTIETKNVLLDESYTSEHFAVVPGPYAMLAISDTGAGMDKETQSRIFEPFFTTKGHHGTGLGLATVFGIVRQCEGNIWVYSEPDRGTTFRVYFPQANEAPTKPAAVVEPRTLEGKETILLVEDQDDVRAVAQHILRRYGYHVLDARNAGEALLVCERHPRSIHLLLTDVVMPHMSGRELAERLLLIRPEMRVLYMSGYTENAIVHHGILDSGIEYLQKPIVPEALARRIREVLDSPRRARSVSPGEG
jgi:signal transduction histidine kinase/ActR/RegA family two-component response regulator